MNIPVSLTRESPWDICMLCVFCQGLGKSVSLSVCLSVSQSARPSLPPSVGQSVSWEVSKRLYFIRVTLNSDD